MAHLRSTDWVRNCLLFRVDRTYRGHHESDANDPQRTWRNGLLNHLVGGDEIISRGPTG